MCVQSFQQSVQHLVRTRLYQCVWALFPRTQRQELKEHVIVDKREKKDEILLKQWPSPTRMSIIVDQSVHREPVQSICRALHTQLLQ